MIAKSDVVILVVSVTLLAAGIYRWQSNVSQAQSRYTVVSSPAASQRNTNQVASSTSSTAKPNTAPASVTTAVTPASESGISASVESNFGNASQVNAPKPSMPITVVGSGNTSESASQSDTGNKTRQPLYGNYKVKAGDSLSRIAADYGTTVDTLRDINDISGTLITVGQNLLYPLPAN